MIISRKRFQEEIRKAKIEVEDEMCRRREMGDLRSELWKLEERISRMEAKVFPPAQPTCDCIRNK